MAKRSSKRKTKPKCKRGKSFSCGFSCQPIMRNGKETKCSSNVDDKGNKVVENYAQFLSRTEAKTSKPKPASMLDTTEEDVKKRLSDWAAKHGLDDDFSPPHDAIHLILHEMLDTDSAGIKSMFKDDTKASVTFAEEMIISLLAREVHHKVASGDPFTGEDKGSLDDVEAKARTVLDNDLKKISKAYPDSVPTTFDKDFLIETYMNMVKGPKFQDYETLILDIKHNGKYNLAPAPFL